MLPLLVIHAPAVCQVICEIAGWRDPQGPKVIGGDFNTNDFYWLSNVLPVPRPGAQAGAVERLMFANGFQAPLQDERATFNHLGMHLDWIYTHALEPKAAAVHDVPFSDHRALVVRFAKRRKPGAS
jgi:endonuclease/exonuclease/phosphatase (EEP) superfamily protein YafD